MNQLRVLSDEDYSALFWSAFESTEGLREDAGRRLGAFREELAAAMTAAGFPGLPEGWMALDEADASPELLHEMQRALEINDRRVLSYHGARTTAFGEVALMQHDGERGGVGTLFGTQWSVISAGHVVAATRDVLFENEPALRFCNERVLPGRDVAVATLPGSVAHVPQEAASPADIAAASDGVVISYAGVMAPPGRQEIQVQLSRYRTWLLGVSTGGTPNALLHSRDSGCPLLIQSGGAWRLAGVMVRVSGPSTGVFEVLDAAAQQDIANNLRAAPGCP